MTERLRLTTLSIVAFELNAAIDQGLIDKFSYDEVYEKIADGSLIVFLRERLGDAIDISLLEHDPEQSTLFIELLQRTANCVTGSDFGVEKHGICLLLAFCIEAMQHPSNWNFELELEKMKKR
jgi:hypothetical protein